MQFEANFRVYMYLNLWVKFIGGHKSVNSLITKLTFS